LICDLLEEIKIEKLDRMREQFFLFGGKHLSWIRPQGVIQMFMKVWCLFDTTVHFMVFLYIITYSAIDKTDQAGGIINI